MPCSNVYIRRIFRDDFRMMMVPNMLESDVIIREQSLTIAIVLSMMKEMLKWPLQSQLNISVFSDSYEKILTGFLYGTLESPLRTQMAV